MKAFGWQLAEVLAATHMQSIGFPDAQSTGLGADKGLDAVSEQAVAQVKAYTTPVGAPDVQKLKGASHGIENALFYSLSGYTVQALEFAENAGVALFTFDESNNVEPVNPVALRLVLRSNVSSADEYLSVVLRNHGKFVKQWVGFLDYFVEWLVISPWGLHMPLDLGEKLVQATEVMTQTVKLPQFNSDSAEVFLDLVDRQRESVEKGIQALGALVGIDLQGLSPSQCKRLLESILGGDISSLTIPSHLMQLLEKFSSHEEGWRSLTECNHVVVRFKKFVKAANENNKKIDVPSLEKDARTREAYLEVKEIVGKFSAWGNRAFEQGDATPQEGERLLREFSFAYARVIAVFGQDIEKLWKKSQKIPAKEL